MKDMWSPSDFAKDREYADYLRELREILEVVTS